MFLPLGYHFSKNNVIETVFAKKAKVKQGCLGKPLGGWQCNLPGILGIIVRSKWRFGVCFVVKGNCFLVTKSHKMGNPTEPMTQGLLKMLSSINFYKNALSYL